MMRKIFQTLLTVIAIGLCIKASAQKTTRFEGFIPMVNGDSAAVRYDYYNTRGQRYLQGPFQLEAKSTPLQDSLTFEKLIWKGSFSKNLKDGDWEYQIQQHEVKINEIENFTIKSTLQSHYNTLKAHYIAGTPDGKWTFERTFFEQGSKRKQKKEGSFNFKNGLLTGSLEIELNDQQRATVKGEFDERGYMHGLWTITYKQDTIDIYETRQYEHGFLLSILKTTQSTGDTVQLVTYTDVIQKLKALEQLPNDNTMAIAKKHFPVTFDQGYRKTNVSLLAQQNGNTLIANSINEMLSLDTTYRNPANVIYGTARFQYVQPKEEINALSFIEIYVDSLETTLDKIKNRNLFEVNNQRSDSLAWSYHFLTNYAGRLENLKSIIKFVKSDDYQYVSPTIYLQQRTPFIKPADSTRYDFDDEERVKITSYNIPEVASLQQLQDRLVEEHHLIKNTVNYVNRELQLVLQSDQLQQLDSIILSTHHDIDERFNTISDKRTIALAQDIQKKFVTTEFNRMKRAYSNSNNFDEKLAMGYDILNYLITLQKLPERLEKIYIMHDSVDLAYTESKLDPYTFSYVKTKVKRRLYEKSAEELFLYLINALRATNKVEDSMKAIERIEQLHKKLMELRVENTAQLERKIKPKSTPQEIQQLLGIE